MHAFRSPTPVHSAACYLPTPPLLAAAARADLEAEGHQLPTQMLSLMNLLEKEGPRFSDRLLVTVRGELGSKTTQQQATMRSSRQNSAALSRSLNSLPRR